MGANKKKSRNARAQHKNLISFKVQNASKEGTQPPEQKSSQPNTNPNQAVSIIKKVFSKAERFRIGYIVALIIGLIPYLFSFTPIADVIHPIYVRPSTLVASTGNLDGVPLSATKQFIVINKKNQILYGVTVIADLPEGLKTKDVSITRITPADYLDLPMYFPMVGGHSNISGRDYFQLNIRRILPGASNMVVYSVNITAENITEPIKLSCVHFSTSDEGILFNNGSMIQKDSPMFVPK